MKIQTKTFLVSLNKNELTALANEVKETIAFSFETAAPKKLFTAADFWKVQKMRKERNGRKFIF